MKYGRMDSILCPKPSTRQLKTYNNFTNSLVLSVVVYIMYTVDINGKRKLHSIQDLVTIVANNNLETTIVAR